MKYIIYLVLALWSCALNAQPILQVDTIRSPEEVGKHFFLLDTHTETFDLAKLRATPFTLASFTIDNHEKNKVYWFEIKFERKAKQQLILDFIFGLRTQISHLDFFLVREDQLVKHTQEGWFDREKTEYQGKLARFQLALDPQVEYSLFIRVKHEHSPKIVINPELKLKDEVIKSFYIKNLQNGVFHGMLWVMFFYNLFIFFSTRDKQYLYYALYILSASFQFIFFENLAVEWFDFDPRFQNTTAIIGLNAGPVFYYLFAQRFLDFRLFCPAWIKPVKIAIIINLLSIVAEFVFWFSTYNFYWLETYSSVKIGLQALLLLAINFKLLGARNTAVYYFAGGSLLLWGSVIVGAVAYIVFNMPNVLIWSQLGIVIELVVFSLGLGYKIRMNEKARVVAHEQLIDQLQRNEELQQTVNRELESAVQLRTLEITSQKRVIEEKNRSITDSITYAKRIQNAVFPNTDALQKVFADSFVYWVPRDIVSGDFFWLRQQRGKIIFAAADCTGHGVPGAFMSMLAASTLSEISRSAGLNDPAEILEAMRESIKHALHQKGAPRESQDGLDIAVVIYDEQTHKLLYAGANNPIYIISNQQKEAARVTKNPNPSRNDRNLYEIKATPNPIGFYVKEKPFQSHEIQLHKGDCFYVFSDGIIDQFGGIGYRKFSSKRFKHLLLEIEHESAHNQRKIIDQTMNKWKGDTPQIDDILIVGVIV